MSPLWYFVATLTRPGKSFKEIQGTVAAAYGDNSLKKTQINAIIKNVKEGKPTTDQWKLNGRRKVWNLAFIMMSPPTSKDPGVTVRKLALAHGVSKTPFTILFTRT
jgi:hypothetical protein